MNWRFGARTKEGDKAVPVLLLVRKLCAEVGITISHAPAAIEGLTINSLELSYGSRRNSFDIECWGQLPVNGLTLDCGFTIAHQSGDSSEPHSGGEVLLRPEGRKPLSFSLKFGTADDSKYFLAGFLRPEWLSPEYPKPGEIPSHRGPSRTHTCQLRSLPQQRLAGVQPARPRAHVGTRSPPFCRRSWRECGLYRVPGGRQRFTGGHDGRASEPASHGCLHAAQSIVGREIQQAHPRWYESTI